MIEGFMAAEEQHQQAWLLGCLNAILDPTLQFRNEAEEALSKASLQPGYGVALAKVVLDTRLGVGLRQLAAVLVKQYVKHHWMFDEKDYIPPTVPPQDKEVIRSLLPLAIGDQENKIRTAVGMAIASIAAVDWPEEWPTLMPHILDCINDKTDVNKVKGAIGCLSLFASEVDDQQLPHLVPILFPALHNIISSPQAYDRSTRRSALVVLHSCIATIGIMSAAYEAQTKALIAPMLRPWMEQLALILSSPVRSDDPEDWALKHEAFQVLQHFVQNFPKLAFNELSVVMEPVWQSFVSGYHCYEAAVIRGVAQLDSSKLADSEGNDLRLEAFGTQMVEFLVTLAGLPRYHQVLRKSMRDIAYYVIGYIQITEEQVETWSADAGEFLSEEESLSLSLRGSGILLLHEIVDSFERDGALCIVDAVNRRMADAEKLKAQSDNGWWKIREAAILTLGLCLDGKPSDVKDFGLDSFLNRILDEDLSEDVKICPFLYGRVLSIAAKFTHSLREDQQRKLLFAAAEGLSDNTNVPVLFGSCKALPELLPKVDASVSQPYLRSILDMLCALLQQDDEEILHTIFPALRSAIIADKNHSIADIEAIVSPLLLNIWVKYIVDPLINMEALDTLEIIKNVPGCWEPLFARVLPSVTGILHQPQDQTAELVAGAIDLLATLLKDAPLGLIKPAYDALFNCVVSLILQTDDASILQNGTRFLLHIVGRAGENLLSWGIDSGKMLIDVAARLLNPEYQYSSTYTASYVVQLIEKLPSQISPCLRDLTTALVLRLEATPLKESLIFVFAKLVHMSAPNYSQLFDLLMGVPSIFYGNGLNCVMAEWTKCHHEIQGSYQIKVSTTALANLLASGHPVLSQIFVPGRLMETTGGIKTRSKARVQPDRWTSVSLAQKIFSLLADSIIEARETAKNSDEDEDWEEVGDDDRTGIEEALKQFSNSPFQPAEHYEHLLNEQVPDEEDELFDVFHSTDPISKVDLPTYLRDFMKRYSTEAPSVFAELFKELSGREKKAVQAVLAS